MQKTCAQLWCKQPFNIYPEDLVFLEKVSPVFHGKKELIPSPTLCPSCRRQRRHAHRNERNLYHRKCDLTGRPIISVFAPERNVVVYNHRDWWGDQWDAHTYGKKFNFNRPFFEQFEELLRIVPHMNVAVGNVENSDYCQLVADCKNCYLVFESSHAEDCFHGFWLQQCRDCSDASFSHECERCYEVDNCYGCHQLFWSRNCTHCFDSAFLLDCIGCSDCLCCVNLRQKKYCIFNEQLTKEEYASRRKSLDFESRSVVMLVQERFYNFALTQPRQYMTSTQSENCTGNYIQESKNCRDCFHAHQAEDCIYAEHVWRGAKDGMDVVTFGRNAELMYETTNTNMGAARDVFDIQCWSSSDVLYSSGCCSCRHCFGCVNMVKAEYCILNMQYTKEEYETFVPKIIEYMRTTNEWGEFFPVSTSPFTYHESVAQELFPLSLEDVRRRSWHWEEEHYSQDQYLGPNVVVPDALRDVPDDFSTQILRCELSGKPYKVIPQELSFYQSLGVPVPVRSPHQRHQDRMALRNPLQLWDRTCDTCSVEIQTTYSPDRPEKILCERCYLETVY